MLRYAFMVDAFAASGIVAVVAGLVGTFLVLRRQAFAGHALSHVGFAGATGAVLLGLPPLPGLVALTVLAGAAMGLLGERLAERDVAVGTVLALSLALGLLFLHFLTSFATQATSLLFGNVLAVDGPTIAALGGLSVICLAVLAVIGRPLLFATLQPELAAARGVRVRALSAAFLALVGLATAGSAEIVGVLLVFALMVLPAASAQLLARTIAGQAALAVLLALVEAWGGLAIAYESDWPTSFCITALATLVHLGAMLAGLGTWPRRPRTAVRNAAPR